MSVGVSAVGEAEAGWEAVGSLVVTAAAAGAIGVGVSPAQPAAIPTIKSRTRIMNLYARNIIFHTFAV
jgi:hypothetical protein